MSETSFLRSVSSEDLTLLSEISAMLTLADPDQLFERVIETTASAFRAERASLLLVADPPSGQKAALLEYRAGKPVQRITAGEGAYPAEILDHGLAGWVLAHGQGVLIANAAEDPRWVHVEGVTSAAGAVMCVPMAFHGRVLGVLTLQHSQPGRYTAHELNVLSIIANEATVALQNAHMLRRMQQRERQFAAILSAMPDVLLVLDGAGTVLLVNAAGAALIGCSEAQALGRQMRDLAAANEVLAQLQDAITQHGSDEPVRILEARSSAELRDYAVTITTWRSGQEAPGHVIVVRDITQLRDLNRFKDEMLNMASHDLRSPLALIVGYCSLIALEVAEGSPINEHLDAIYRAIDRMQGLLDDLLRVEKIRTSPLEMVESMDFRLVLEAAVEHMRPYFEARSQTLDVEAHFDGPTMVRMNGPLVREAVENYLDNASKYTPEHGRITLRAALRDGRMEVTVSDSGPGIAPEALPRVFEAFFRARSPGVEGIEGRGLGLHLVRTVIERHQGEVWVKSQLGHGSTFGFWLPLT